MGFEDKMSTKRYVLYTEEDKFKMPSFLAAQVHIQPLAELQNVPEWLQALPKPLLVDTVKKVGLWGTELDTFIASKRPSKFVPVESLSDTL
jgi:hypothetical protein